MKTNTRIFVAGHNGMLGGAILKILKENTKNKIYTKNKKHLNLLEQSNVNSFFKKNKFDQVYLCAARVGGIMANKNNPATFIYENLTMQTNIIHASYLSKVKKLLFIGSTCVYPKQAKQPLKEEFLLSSYLEESNEPYAISKIAGIKMCESYNRQYNTDFRSVMPPNMYGIGDSFDPKKSHVISGLIRKFYVAKIKKRKSVKLWGTGKPIREFLYVDDAASICIKIMNARKSAITKVTEPQMSHINIGTGKGISIKKLAILISNIVGYKGKILFDSKYPDGHPKKVACIDKQKKIISNSIIDFRTGIKKTYDFFLLGNAPKHK
jgi:GDP-L-fucose synthase